MFGDPSRVATSLLAWCRQRLSLAQVTRLVQIGIDYEAFLREGEEGPFVERALHGYRTGEWGAGPTVDDAERLICRLFEFAYLNDDKDDKALVIYAAAIILEGIGRSNMHSQWADGALDVMLHSAEKLNILALDLALIEFLDGLRSDDRLPGMASFGVAHVALRIASKRLVPLEDIINDLETALEASNHGWWERLGATKGDAGRLHDYMLALRPE